MYCYYIVYQRWHSRLASNTANRKPMAWGTPGHTSHLFDASSVLRQVCSCEGLLHYGRWRNEVKQSIMTLYIHPTGLP
jgi:hypothetical protein